MGGAWADNEAAAADALFAAVVAFGKVWLAEGGKALLVLPPLLLRVLEAPVVEAAAPAAAAVLFAFMVVAVVGLEWLGASEGCTGGSFPSNGDDDKDDEEGAAGCSGDGGVFVAAAAAAATAAAEGCGC